MVKIISFLIHLLNLINKLSFKLQCWLTRFLPNDPNPSPHSNPYRYFQVDEPPVLKSEHSTISFLQAKELYKQKHGKDLSPVLRRSKCSIPKKTKCPRCGVSHNYIYDNNGGNQFLCKACEFTFTSKKSYSEQISHYCPHCGNKLQAAKDRDNYIIFKCHSYKCSFYKKNRKSLSKSDKKRFKIAPQEFKLHYITRVFDASLEQLEDLQSKIMPSKVELSRIRNSKHVLGLALTYCINYGLSLRKTALALFEVHDIKISHQTIANYLEAASHTLNPWLDYFKYNLNDYLCGDETYVKVLGKKAYVFFVCDMKRKIITSFNIFMKRDSFSAIQTLYSTIRKFKDSIPTTLHFIVDGNPIYKVAQQYFHQRHIKFKLTQVIGLTNDDPVSKEHRPAKQVIERLNRTFKETYLVKNGFNSLERANDYMCLFTTYFNFLRNHKSLGYQPPVKIKCLRGISNMPRKWLSLLDNASKFCEVVEDLDLS